MSTVTDKNGFQVSLEPSEFEDHYKLKVVQVIKFAETRIIPIEVVEDDDFLRMEIERMKDSIRGKINEYPEN